jgi:hypothetical protein
MKPPFTAVCLVAGIAVATTSANARDDVASEAARSVINGIILGGKVGPDFYGFVPANIQARVTASASSKIAAWKRPGYAPPALNRVVNTASVQ